MKKPALYVLCFLTLFLSLFSPVRAATEVSFPPFPSYDESTYKYNFVFHYRTTAGHTYAIYMVSTEPMTLSKDPSKLKMGDTLSVSSKGSMAVDAARYTPSGGWEALPDGMDPVSDHYSLVYVVGMYTDNGKFLGGVSSSNFDVKTDNGDLVFQVPPVQAVVEGLGEVVLKYLIIIVCSTIFLMGLVISLRLLATRLRAYSMRS